MVFFCAATVLYDSKLRQEYAIKHMRDSWNSRVQAEYNGKGRITLSMTLADSAFNEYYFVIETTGKKYWVVAVGATPLCFNYNKFEIIDVQAK